MHHRDDLEPETGSSTPFAVRAAASLATTLIGLIAASGRVGAPEGA